MSYQVLARKWRPQCFDEVTGQSHVITALRNAIRSDRVPQALLLTGMRGVGKTTLARLIARCLNCDNGPTDVPCGECSACSEISGGTSTDVQEIDAASRTSVDDVRELIEAIKYAPSPGKYRIYVVDEVHMLSTPAFNALLKTLEEPPPRSLFIFATTNPEKIPFTVLSRCQRYDLRRIPTATIVDRLHAISAAEDIKISDSSLLAIAREGDGSMRDSMTLLDQVIAFGGNEISDEQVVEVLDLIDRRILISIVEACVDADAQASIEACARAAETGIDAKRLGSELLQVLRDLVVLRTAPKNEDLVEGSDAEVAELKALAERCDATRLRRMFRALLKEQEDLTWAPQPLAVLEMAVVRMASMPAGDDVSRLLARLEKLERLLAEGGAPSGGGGGETASRPTRSGDSDTGKPRSAAAPPSSKRGDSSRPKAVSAPAENVPLETVFARFRTFAQKKNRGLYSALDQGQLLECSETQFRIALPDGFGTKRLIGRLEDLEALCTEFFARTLQVSIETLDEAESAPKIQSRPSAKVVENTRVQTREALNHPAVNRALEILGGEITEIRTLGDKQ